MPYLTKEQQVKLLTTDVKAWNRYRELHPNFIPDLSYVDPTRNSVQVNLTGKNSTVVIDIKVKDNPKRNKSHGYYNSW